MRTLTVKEAKAFYDKFGSKQDKQAFYEKRALETLCANAELQHAQVVFEFGCGTGSFAVNLLEHYLPNDARYFGTDISDTMIELASKRLAQFAPRASVALTVAEAKLPLESGTVDRLVSTYVLDLLADSAQQQVLNEARRVLKPDGLLCLAGVTPGNTPLSRIVMGAWHQIFLRAPGLVGGCRPNRNTEYLPSEDWKVRFRTVVVAWGVASEVVIASPVREPATHA